VPRSNLKTEDVKKMIGNCVSDHVIALPSKRDRDQPPLARARVVCSGGIFKKESETVRRPRCFELAKAFGVGCIDFVRWLALYIRIGSRRSGTFWRITASARPTGRAK
jgi:hypothetical protein